MRMFRNRSGQGMTEYIIIVALIAIAAIAAFTYFGRTVRSHTDAMTQELAGQSGSTALGKAKDAATAAGTDAAKDKNLQDYTNPDTTK